MSAQHPFVVWLVEQYDKKDNPLGDFVSEFAPGLPSTGTRDELRKRLYYTVDEWALDPSTRRGPSTSAP